MIDCDDHNSASNAAPQSRHHLQATIKKYKKNQDDSERRGIIHNHPSGDPQPSRQDVDLTRELIAAAKPLGIAIHDHVVVGTRGQASLRALGLL
ncbi:JAB domain-containing protein [Rhizorhabdus histidinilytica]|uniref:JAB domain-containing protein n=1 Tax=Rhizorhabdus histidinilytica TaxID=439228 RepID=UPI001F44A9FE|nr:JAB domain-containing protein [Rhizorhabdus histidinilytica]